MAARVIDRLGRLGLAAWPLRYGLAGVVVGLAWASRELFLPEAAERSPFVAFGLAILLASLGAGFGPGILATLLSSVIAVLFYLPPYVALAVHAPFDAVLLTVFLVEGLVAAAAGGIVRAALLRDEAIGRSSRRFARFLERAEAVRGWRVSEVEPLTENLTARELEVARLLALGLANDEIARALFVSLNTVKTHLKRIYDKLGVRTRTEAVAKSVELGILEAPPSGDAARFVERAQGLEATSPIQPRPRPISRSHLRG